MLQITDFVSNLFAAEKKQLTALNERLIKVVTAGELVCPEAL